MEKNEFNQIVDNLLEPKLKKYIVLQARKGGYQPILETAQEDHIALVAKPRTCPCEECGLVVTDRVVSFYLRGMGGPRAQWIKKCSECDLKQRVKGPSN